jgi:type IV pilus assembly protein PilW
MNLLELMLVSLLTSFILAGLAELYLVTQKNFELQNAMAHLQEQGRFVSYFLRKRIQMAGYAGCDSTLPLVVQKGAIKGYEKLGERNDTLQLKECVWYHQKNQFISMLYYIVDHSLFNKPKDGMRQEIVDGVAEMHIHYGVKAASGEIKYLSAQNVTNWSEVVSVALDLLLRSTNQVLKKPMSYWYQGHFFRAEDRYLYQAWPIVIALRER